jgi:hypothetical protein
MSINEVLATELKMLLVKGLITEEACLRMAKAWGIEGLVLPENK